MVVEALRRPRSCLGYVGVNALSTEFAYEDLRAVVAPGVDGLVVPKIETPDELKTVEWVVSQLERERDLAPGSIDVIPIIESGAGFAAVQAIARSGTRVRRLAFGAGDFTLDMGVTWNRDEAELLTTGAPSRSVAAAGLEPPIDSVWIDRRPGRVRGSGGARAQGWDSGGKLCIYPSRSSRERRLYADRGEVTRARRVVDAFAEAEATGSASIQLDGQFIDYPIVYQAHASSPSRRSRARRPAAPLDAGGSGKNERYMEHERFRPRGVRPLDGIRVIETSSFLAGPFCSTQLAEFGAEIIKVELPGVGDALRRFGTVTECGESSRGYPNAATKSR